jgi:septal ring factor EnvC (AmiA/AmiB activator)
MFGLSKYVMIGLAVALALMAAAFYFYYNHSQTRIETLNRNNAKLETAVGLQKETIDRMEKRRDEQAKSIIELSREMEKAEFEKEELRKKLNRHDLEKIGRAKAGLLEKAINDGTDKAFKDLENETSNNR